MIKWILVVWMALFATLVLTARANAWDLWPDVVALEAQHTSHITQHEPFQNPPTEYGVDQIDLAIKWKWRGAELALADGVIVGHCQSYGTINFCDSLLGPREVFNARLSYNLWSRK